MSACDGLCRSELKTSCLRAKHSADKRGELTAEAFVAASAAESAAGVTEAVPFAGAAIDAG